MRKERVRIRNPFHDPLVTELIEDPILYRQIFSERILVGETLQVFQPANVVLVGPQGSGKSMILNLIRHAVLSEWISSHGNPPAPLKHLTPFFGISVNLVRANFHAFGRRSISRVIKGGDVDQGLDASCAADFLNHYLFREFLKGVQLLHDRQGKRLRNWLGINTKHLDPTDLVNDMRSWDCWFGYYDGCDSLEAMLTKCDRRLSVWRSFLNANIDEIPPDVWESKSTLGDPLHAIGNLLNSVRSRSKRLPLFVVIDQYEVLPELNPKYGTTLQQMVNTLIKARDPVVFYKIGARTYDWGTELRIWGAESRIEVQRDYVIINLADVLTRREDSRGWLFPDFAKDVAHKRVSVEGHYRFARNKIEKIFGSWSPEDESRTYFREKSRRVVAIGRILDATRQRIESLCDHNPSPLELRLAGAWALQRMQKGSPEPEILEELGKRPWRRQWWRKERIGVALLQVASLANQKKRYSGWKTIIYLSGANISAFLLLCSEIWDMATKMDIHPLKNIPLPPTVQTEGIFVASETWRMRDRNENVGGRKRYEVLSRLGPAIHDYLIEDLAISNPGHSGFSLQEADLWTGQQTDETRKKLTEFLHNAVSWAIFEERAHTSKSPEAASRRKWYLHPLLSPVFAIPYIRVKEPLYVNMQDVYEWIWSRGRLKFGRGRQTGDLQTESSSQQLQIPFTSDQ